MAPSLIRLQMRAKELRASKCSGSAVGRTKIFSDSGHR